MSDEITRRDALKRGAILSGAGMFWRQPSVSAFAISEGTAAVTSGVDADADFHIDLVLLWADEEGGNTSHSLRWTPGLGFEPIPTDEPCIGSAFSPAPETFPYEVLDVTYVPDVSVRFDFAYPLRPAGAKLHTAEGVCLGPDGSGGGLPADVWFYEFDIP